jgi:hypothetical protein
MRENSNAGISLFYYQYDIIYALIISVWTLKKNCCLSLLSKSEARLLSVVAAGIMGKLLVCPTLGGFGDPNNYYTQVVSFPKIQGEV